MSRSLNILLIEDNPDDVFLMQEMLKETSILCNMLVLEDGEAALHYLQGIESIAIANRPSLIVLDLNLPKKNGHEVLNEIRKSSDLQHLPVVVLSTSEDIEDRRKALDANAAYVVKPARFDNLVEFLDTAEFTCMQNVGDAGAVDSTDAVDGANLVSSGNLHLAQRSEQTGGGGDQRTTFQRIEAGLDHVEASELISNSASWKVLLIEDNPYDVLLIETFLKESRVAKCETTTFEDLSSALEFLSDNSADVILADMGLPDAQGLEVLSRLIARADNVPIVILTGLDDENTAIEAVSHGAQDYLVKGQVNGESLSRSLRYAVTRKRAEELALRAVSAEKEILQEILQHAPIGIARFNSGLVISECNSVFLEQIQLPYEKVIGRPVTELLRSSAKEQWQDVVESSRPFRIERHVIKEHSSEAKLVWDITVWPIINRGGGTRGGIILALDITKRIKLEQQREDFIASVAHDIKNPLVGADRILSALTAADLSAADHDKLVALLKDSNTSVLSMLHNLLDIYRYEASAVSLLFEPININGPIQAAVSMTSGAALNKKISIDLECPGQTRLVRADRVAIQRLFSNLLINAFQFSKPESTIKISCEAQREDLVIQVTDSGKGMTEEELGFIFKRFGESRVSKYRGGTGSGLGLYLCKQIVDAHNGSIQCESKVGVGSTFTIKLPLA